MLNGINALRRRSFAVVFPIHSWFVFVPDWLLLAGFHQEFDLLDFLFEILLGLLALGAFGASYLQRSGSDAQWQIQGWRDAPAANFILIHLKVGEGKRSVEHHRNPV